MLINKNILYTKLLEAKNEKGNVIITHGIAESSEEYERLAKTLEENGYNVLLYDVRGHGRSSGKRGDVQSFHLFLDDLHELVSYMKTISDKKVFLLGHSMGGNITNSYVVKYQDVDGVIISAAPNDFLPKVSFMRKIPYKLLNFKKIKTNFSGPGLSRIPFKEGYYPYHLDYIKPRLLGNILVSNIRYLKKNINKYTVPVLFLHGLSDIVVPYQMTETFYNRLKLEDKTLKLYENNLHNLFNDLDYQLVTEDVITWLNNHI
ncbi:Putative lysophospholipase [Alteracholeplasma palmae J233]|uniref:Putative lysophospholipase n=1 Tax=Alteracholeplasma palmae (strain ATCC 49389 / J233) TaxID=1318466 RepID=U4KRV5_ALTPJ|nr:alpha/beta hydrolase [Alteracholeplasma palmae]CCV64476.1 Putative lysophospholipase [Alteracholeplasma palmae J233]